MPGIRILPIAEETPFQTYVAVKADRALSRYAENFVRLLRAEMQAVAGKSAAKT